MPIEVTVPSVGESITEVEIGEWLKQEGAEVKKDETLVVLESEKASVDLPAPASGRLAKLLKKQGDKAQIGDVIAEIELVEAIKEKKAGEGEVRAKVEEPRAKVAAKARPTPATQRVTEISAPSAPARPAAVPADAAVGEERAEREEEVVPMTLLRRTVAQHLVEARQNMAILTTFNEIDMSAVMELRKENQEAFTKKHGVKLGFMSFFVKASVDALRGVPQVNASVRGTDIVYHNYCDIGVAIGSGKGLVVPVLRNAERMSFAEIEKAIGEYAARAQENKLTPDELQGGTFTISNGGIYGSLLSTPIVNPPQSGILGMHAIQERPVAIAGQVVIRPMMYVALSYDHRIIDGREAVTFLRRVKEVIERPERLLLEA